MLASIVNIYEETLTIRRPQQVPSQEGKKSLRINDDIQEAIIQLIDTDGVNHSAISLGDAVGMANEAGLDLVEIVPDREPPLCKLLDYGKYKFQQQKRAAEARKKQKVVDIKEIKMRPNIDSHDYGVKMKAILRFLDEGDKVKITIRFRGREMAHQDLGYDLLKRIETEVGEDVKIEASPKVEGRQMIMIIAPK